MDRKNLVASTKLFNNLKKMKRKTRKQGLNNIMVLGKRREKRRSYLYVEQRVLINYKQGT